MAELKLRFRVINAGVAVHEVPVVHEGEEAILKRRVLHVDAEPLDGTVRTFELELPASLEGQIVEGTVLNATIEFDPPAAEAEVANPEAE